jgi:hypothetical protein
LSDDNQRTYREVQAFFRLPSIALVEKDLIVVRAIAALATIDASPFQLVFGGGTALARAHKVVRRMSEDVGHPLIVARKGQKWAVFLHDKPCRNGELYGNHDGRVFRQADRSRSVPLCVPEGQLVSSGPTAEPITKGGKVVSRRFPEVWVAAADELIEVAVESPCPGLE